VAFALGSAWACASASLGCRKSGVDCVPPPVSAVVCPEAGAPSFTNDVYPNVFAQVCNSCHSLGGQEPSMPFSTYQQIYGKNGAEAQEIFNQVFESCLMPPSNATEPFSMSERQTLLEWLACGAPDDSPASDSPPSDSPPGGGPAGDAAAGD
jgi:hypothetical protein